MNNKLCPFCGSDKLSVESIKPAWGSHDSEPHVICDECASSAPIFIWNKRGEKKKVEHSKQSE